METEPLCASLLNLADMLTMLRGWTLLILEVKGEGHFDLYSNNLVNMIETGPFCASSSNGACMLSMWKRLTQLTLEV